MSVEKIRVGIIGAGGWAKYGHIPALQLLDQFEITAVSSRKKTTADQLASAFDIPYAFDNEQDLITHPEVDLVVILAPGPEHARITEAVISAGKDVYTEWPLSTKTTESENLLTLAEAHGVRHVVGLQRRFTPSARYVRDLIKQGFVGTIRSVHMSVGTNAFAAQMPQSAEWTLDPANFTHVLSVYGGHFQDQLFNAVGFPSNLAAVVQNKIPTVRIIETGELCPYQNPTEVMVIGTLEAGGLFSIQLQGGQERRTGLQIDIFGTEGALRITNAHAYKNKEDNTVHAMTGACEIFQPLPVPAQYRYLDGSDLDASVLSVAYLYLAYAADKLNRTSTASNFGDAIRQHHLIDQIIDSSKAFSQRDRCL